MRVPSSCGIAMPQLRVHRHQQPEGGDTIHAMLSGLSVSSCRVAKSNDLFPLTLFEWVKKIVMNNIFNSIRFKWRHCRVLNFLFFVTHRIRWEELDWVLSMYRMLASNTMTLPMHSTPLHIEITLSVDYLYIRKVKVHVQK